jgi:acetyl-CoA C-acetyltransferase
MRRANIVATFGPAVASYENILAVLEAGSDVARMNTSHGDYTVPHVAGPDSTLKHQPARAIAQAAAQTGLAAADFDLIEIYEAFALVALDSAAAPNIPAEKINANGGGIALGQPIGASGARLVLHTGLELGRRGTGRGVAALCGGRGQGDAMVPYGPDQTA